MKTISTTSHPSAANSICLHVSDNVYEQLARQVVDIITYHYGQCRYSVNIDSYDDDGNCFNLEGSIYVDYKPIDCPDIYYFEIDSVVFVWFHITSYTYMGEAAVTDFSESELLTNINSLIKN